LNLPNECGQHALNFVDSLHKLGAFSLSQIIQVSRQQQMIFKFDGRTTRDM